jgi:hypothetical protein
MTDYKPIPVSEARAIADDYGKDIVVILCWDAEHGLTHTTTYGVTAFDKENAAAAGEICAKALGADLGKKQFHEDFHGDYSPARLKALEEACPLLRDACVETLNNFTGSELVQTVAANLKEADRIMKR